MALESGSFYISRLDLPVYKNHGQSRKIKSRLIFKTYKFTAKSQHHSQSCCVYKNCLKKVFVGAFETG